MNVMEFREKGYSVLRDILTAQELERIRTVISDEVARRANELYAQGAIPETFEHLPFSRRWIEICKLHSQKEKGWNRSIFSKAIYDLCTNAKLLDIIEDMIGPEVMVNGDYWVRPKLPHEDMTTLPWHQDSFYYNGPDAGASFIQIVSVWIPLVDVDEVNGCLQLIPFSHTWGLIPCARNAQGHLEPVEDVEQRGNVETVSMQTGDILLFNQLTLHRSLPNRSDEVRWSIDLRYSPADQPLTYHVDPDYDKKYPCLIARSRSTDRVMGWNEWHAKHLRRI